MRTSLLLSGLFCAALAGSVAADTAPTKPVGSVDSPVLTESKATIDHTCLEGQDVTITGSNNQINLTGPCETVTIDGSENQVHIDRVVAIKGKGDRNNVDWHKGATSRIDPAVAMIGKGNTVKRRPAD